MPAEPYYLLCIDDDPQSLQVRKVLLETSNFRVATATSGPEGLRAVRSHEFAAVIVDYHMPGMDGGEVARELKKWDPSLPVIVLSALPSLPLDAPAECVDAFVSKTEPLAVLVNALNRLIGSRRFHPRSGGTTHRDWPGRVARAAGTVAGLTVGVLGRVLHRPRRFAHTTSRPRVKSAFSIAQI